MELESRQSQRERAKQSDTFYTRWNWNQGKAMICIICIRFHSILDGIGIKAKLKLVRRDSLIDSILDGIGIKAKLLLDAHSMMVNSILDGIGIKAKLQNKYVNSPADSILDGIGIKAKLQGENTIPEYILY